MVNIFLGKKLLKSVILEIFRIWKFKILFNHGEHILRGKVVEIVHSREFHDFEIQNFLQPW